MQSGDGDISAYDFLVAYISDRISGPQHNPFAPRAATNLSERQIIQLGSAWPLNRKAECLKLAIKVTLQLCCHLSKILILSRNNLAMGEFLASLVVQLA
jgi:hypothetical protein